MKLAPLVFADTHHVLGRRLHPFTLGHQLLLEYIGSPLCGQGESTLVDYKLAVAICRRSYPRAVRFVQGGPHRLILFLTPPFTPPQAALASLQLARYFEHYCRVPETWTKPGGRTPGTEFFHAVKVTLQTQFGLTQEQALSTPLDIAIADYCAYWELWGCLELVTESEKRAMKALEEEIPPEIQAIIDRQLEQMREFNRQRRN